MKFVRQVGNMLLYLYRVNLKLRTNLLHIATFDPCHRWAFSGQPMCSTTPHGYHWRHHATLDRLYRGKYSNMTATSVTNAGGQV